MPKVQVYVRCAAGREALIRAGATNIYNVKDDLFACDFQPGDLDKARAACESLTIARSFASSC